MLEFRHAWMASIAFAAFVLGGVAAATTTTVIDLPVPGGTQRFLYVRPDAPAATIVWLTGGPGFLGIQSDGSMLDAVQQCDPVVRNRNALASRGIALVLVDVASDVREYADVREVIRYVHSRDNAATWIMGWAGAAAATASIAANSPAGEIHGVAFFAPFAVPSHVAGLIRGPALVMYHAGDRLSAPYIDPLFNELAAASPRERVAFYEDRGGVVCPPFMYHTISGFDAEIVDAVSSFIVKNSPAPVSATPSLNQHGLTGSWYQAATSGQGLEVEIFPDLMGPGTGLAQVSWFTFDHAAIGGAERQRWYTLQGNVVTGAASASLTILQNVGGNFNAPPVTTAQQVGSATLRFSACDRGQLDYAFSDGSGRAGVIPITRLTQNVTCSTTSARPVSADFAFSGNWYDPAASGQGLTIEINDLNLAAFFAWYTYAPAGSASGAAGQRWFTGQSTYTPGARTLAMELYETTGGLFDVPTPSPTSVPVGTATLSFQSCSAARLAYSFTGGSNAGTSGAIALSRVGPVPPGCAM